MATEVELNGKSQEINSANVDALLDELGLRGKRLAVELNREIVPSSRFCSTELSAGDKIEIIHFVGGG